MNFYKLREPSENYVEGERNIYMKEDVLLWAKDINRMENLGLEIGDNIELAIDVLDNYNEFLIQVV